MPITKKPKTRLKMASEYAVCVKTFISMLEEYDIKLKPRKLIYFDKQKEIYNKLGVPPN